MTLEAIKEAIQHLPDEERRALAGWLEQMEEAAWDAEIERDFAPGGRGEALEKRVRREIAEGKARPLEEGLAKRRHSHSSSFGRWRCQGFGIFTTACPWKFRLKPTSNTRCSPKILGTPR